MHIILLSGGSGKRLWPLSNGARSKQFLQFLQAPDGSKESMVQRVVRQLGESALATSITVATSESQRDFVTTQLGDRVDIVTEPERRGTFPAIALSAAYLSLYRGLSPDEVVVVMPCDSYVDSSYYNTLATIAQQVRQGVADLVLMGVTPTRPSTRFGYILAEPTDAQAISHSVQRFVEKPDADTATSLLTQGAYWNGGVFAFRLGHVMNIVSQHLQAPTFAEFRNRYSELPKNSFDYEVVEHAPSVSVVPHHGMWKELGSWNALVEELPTTTMGHVILGDDVRSTTVINELYLPVVCDGVSDLVVAASYDGILVCSKDSSEYLKRYTGTINHRPMYEERRWGVYRVLDDTHYADGSHSLTKSITIAPGKNISYQVHHHRSEVWTFVEGEGLFVLDGQARRVKVGDTVVIPAEHFHAIKALTELTFIEVQYGNPLIEEDIERFDFDWEAVNV